MQTETFTAARTRRAFLRSLAPAAALGLAACEKWQPASAKPPAPPTQPFTFIQINDLHYVGGPCAEWFRAVVAQIKASAPSAAFCLLCGDLADTGDPAALAAVRDIFGGLDIPLRAVPGNHDFTDAGSRAGYDAAFPGMLNYRFTHGGWQFIGLDTTMGTKYDKTTIADTTIASLDAADARMPTVAFTHFPLGEKVAYTPLNAPALVARLLRLRLVAAFSGHWHGASERTAGSATLTTNRCCARVRNNHDKSREKGWFMCHTRPDGTLTRRFVEFIAPPGIPQGKA